MPYLDEIPTEEEINTLLNKVEQDSLDDEWKVKVHKEIQLLYDVWHSQPVTQEMMKDVTHLIYRVTFTPTKHYKD